MKANYKSLLLVALCLFLVPMIGVITWYFVDNKYETNFVEAVAAEYKVTVNDVVAKEVTLDKLCSLESDKSGLETICSYVDDIHLLKQASIYSLIAGLLLILFIIGTRSLIGLDRKKLAALFSPVTTISMLVLAGSIVIQGFILVYSLYIAGAVYTERVFPKLLFIIGLSAAVAAYVLIKSIISTLKTKPTLIFGQLITNSNGSGLINLVNDIATKVGAKAPENIVVGLEPNFYVTATTVEIAGEGKPLKNTTMYLSLPFLSIFSKDELVGVIGHELGHFKGEDTAYSMRFYPAYSKLYKALEGMSQQSEGESSIGLFTIPAMATLNFILNEFSIPERTIGRGREFEADKVGASVVGGLPLITALMKVSEYAPIWDELRRFNIDKLAEGVIYNDLGGIYCEATNDRFENINFEKSKENLFKSQMAHLTDTHPTLSERMESLNVSDTSLGIEQLKPANTLLNTYLSDIDKLNENLSFIEHKLMVAYGLVVIPEEKQ